MHESPSMHEACMVLSSMHDTCMNPPSMHGTYIVVTPDTVSDNFGSKSSKQLQGTAVAIFSNFCEVFACKSVAQVALWL